MHQPASDQIDPAIEPVDVADESAGNDRRRLLTRGGVAAAVAAVAGIGLSREAHAADGGTMVIGATNTGTLTTELTGSTLSVEAGNDSGGAIRGWTGFEGPATAGVEGSSTVEGGYGVHGQSSGGGIPNQRGVYGEDRTLNGVGVYGEHGNTFPGIGVLAASTNGDGLVARGTTTDDAQGAVDIRVDGTGIIEFDASQTMTPTTAGPAGRLVRGDDDNLWFSTDEDRWERLTSRPAFTPIDPYRAYDSRKDAAGRLSANGARTVGVKDARDVSTGAVVTSDVIPAGATAIAYNLTAIGTSGGGFLAIAAGSATTFGASAINWTAPTTIANAGIVTIDASRQVKVFCGPAGSANFALDITGYWK